MKNRFVTKCTFPSSDNHKNCKYCGGYKYVISEKCVEILLNTCDSKVTWSNSDKYEYGYIFKENELSTLLV